jgi:hypothetical protein
MMVMIKKESKYKIMKNYFNNLVYVIDQHFDILKAIEAHLKKDYKVSIFLDYQSFNEELQKQSEILPHILIMRASSIDKIISENNEIIIIDNSYKVYSNSENLVISLPFTKSELIETVKKAEIYLNEKIATYNQKNLDGELPINDSEDKKRIKV